MGLETKVTVASAEGKECYGCKRFNSDVMVTMVDSKGAFNDFFLSNEQATYLKLKLTSAIRDNLKEKRNNSWERLRKFFIGGVSKTKK